MPSPIWHQAPFYLMKNAFKFVLRKNKMPNKTSDFLQKPPGLTEKTENLPGASDPLSTFLTDNFLTCSATYKCHHCICYK